MLIAPGGLWLLIFFIIPLFSLGRLSVQDGGFSNFANVISDNSTVIVRTFVYATCATIAAIIIGYPLAYVIATKGGRFKNLLLALVVLPFFVTYLVRTLSWKILLFDGGPVVGILHSLGILGEEQGILGSPFAVIAALTYNFLPFMVLPIYVSLEKIDRRLLDAAADLYSSPARAFRKVTLPLSLPGLFAGTLLTFIPAAGDFVNSELLGSERTVMIGVPCVTLEWTIVDPPNTTCVAVRSAETSTASVMMPLPVRTARRPPTSLPSALEVTSTAAGARSATSAARTSTLGATG